jgi:hypothetical protein
MNAKPLPPGSAGLPLVGETLAFAKNPFRFIDERLARRTPSEQRTKVWP